MKKQEGGKLEDCPTVSSNDLNSNHVGISTKIKIIERKYVNKNGIFNQIIKCIEYF